MVSLVTSMVLVGLMGSGPPQPVVPLNLQIELLGKVLRYDRSFVERAGTEFTILVVHTPALPDSLRVARQAMAALENQQLMGGVRHRDELVAFSTAAAVARLAKERRAAVILFTPELSSQAAEISTAFDGCDCITVSTTSEGVSSGLVLGFDLVSGKPRMLFNLKQSRKQRSDFRAEVLQLMTVFQ